MTKPKVKTLNAQETLQHAEWHCRFGSESVFCREPEACDLEAAAILRRLRERLLGTGKNLAFEIAKGLNTGK
jgi:hypothetical protein